MSRTVTAVIEGDAIHPSEPLNLPDGTLVEVRLPDNEPVSKVDTDAEMRQWDEALEAFWEEGGKLGPDWWAQFQDELRRNRMTFEERL